MTSSRVDETPVVALDPAGELLQRLGVVVRAHAGVDPVVPAVQAAQQVVAVDVAVGQQRAAVQAPAVEHRVVVAPPDDHQVDALDHGADRRPVGHLAPGRHLHRPPLAHHSKFVHVGSVPPPRPSLQTSDHMRSTWRRPVGLRSRTIHSRDATPWTKGSTHAEREAQDRGHDRGGAGAERGQPRPRPPASAQAGRAAIAGSKPSWANPDARVADAGSSDTIQFRVYLALSDRAGAEATARAVSDPSSPTLSPVPQRRSGAGPVRAERGVGRLGEAVAQGRRHHRRRRAGQPSLRRGHRARSPRSRSCSASTSASTRCAARTSAASTATSPSRPAWPPPSPA